MFTNNIFVTKWLKNKCAFIDTKGNSRVENFDFTPYVHVHVLVNSVTVFRERIQLLIDLNAIDRIEYGENLKNLRNERRITANDISRGLLSGMSAFLFCNPHHYEYIERFLRCNRTYFGLYDVSNKYDMRMQYFQCSKRKFADFSIYGIFTNEKQFLSNSEHIPLHRVCAFDIELTTDINKHRIALGGGLHDKIVAVSFVVAQYAPGENVFEIERSFVYVLWPDRNYKATIENVTIFQTEKELLVAVCKLFGSELNASIIIGYNSNGFDFPVILNRMIALGLGTEYCTTDELNKFMTGRLFILPCCEKYQIIDVYQVIKNIFPNQFDSYSLDSIAKTVLSRSKEPMSFTALNITYFNAFKHKVYDGQFFEKLCTYVLTDSILTIEIYVKLNLETHVYSIINVCFSDALDFYRGNSALTKNYFSIMYPVNGIVYNSYRDPMRINSVHGDNAFFSSVTNKTYKGATVMSTKRNIYAKKTISVLDFTSLYPSIIQEFNLSPLYVLGTEDVSELGNDPYQLEKFRAKTRKIGEYYAIKSNFHSTPLAIILKLLIEKRKSAKTTSLNKAYKVVANSIYGLLALQSSTHYLAALVTAFGRNIHSTVLKFLTDEEHQNVIYGDTDSFFVFSDRGDVLADIVNKFLANQGYQYIRIMLDYTATSSIFLAEKKKYILKLADGNLKKAGLQRKQISSKFLTFSDRFLELLFEIIEKYYCDEENKVRKNFIPKFRSLVRTTLENILNNTTEDDYFLSVKNVPFYEYSNMSSFNATCSYRYSLISSAPVGEIRYSFVLSSTDQGRKKKKDSFEFYENIKAFRIPIDRIEYIKKVFNYVILLEKHVLKTNIFTDVCDSIRVNEIKNSVHKSLLNHNIWTVKKTPQKWIIYYDEIFPALSAFRIHFWENRDRSYQQTLLILRSDFNLYYVTGELFSFSELIDFMMVYDFQKINLYIQDGGVGTIDSQEKVVRFLSLLYTKPNRCITNTAYNHTPQGEMIITDRNGIKIVTF